MAYALLAHTIQGSTDKNDFTTSAINTSGSDLLIAIQMADAIGTHPTDSASNTSWTQGPDNNFFGTHCTLWFAWNATGSASHTFTSNAGVNSSPALAILAFSGSKTSASPVDQTTSAEVNFGSSLSTGGITPTAAGCLVVTGGVYVDTANALSLTVLTLLDQELQLNGGHRGGGSGYQIQTTATSVNPAWSESAANLGAMVLASFLPSAGGGGGGTYSLFDEANLQGNLISMTGGFQ